MQIADKKVVYIHYTLKNQEGTVLDSSSQKTPLAYIHGLGNIIPGLEKALAGKGEGDKLNVSIGPKDAYGERNETLLQTVPRDAFQDVEELEKGMQFQAQTPNGPQLITVAKIETDRVLVDANHPLAGETLDFDVEVVDVRNATEEELEHGHAHGAGGHEHA
ncbi:FKBP-type peptidyl-prolyl cis-trans isomerase [Nitrosococcus watsonii]|uniref:Peptidyl-prolyl cis-trans isomerase n=1 Tax=Nitrosococcus watsoni (strain C-113) TaxID=105559 RepID=D8K7A5_NITWC|nr:peptidylprolyl isomerase FKBP-type [Nitrosococcus watsonii C-113]